MKKENKKLLSLCLAVSVATILHAGNIEINTSVTSGVVNGGDGNVTVTKTGSITVDGVAVDINTTLESGKSVTNEGNITSNKDSTIIFERDVNGTFLNDSKGIIDSNKTAVVIKGFNNNEIINSGIIKSSTENGIYLQYGINPLTYDYYSNKGKIVNKGQIIVEHKGIYVSYNEGNITNSGTIETTNGAGIDLYLDNSREAIIINSGTIHTGNGAGISLEYGDNLGTIVNSGTIQIGSGDGININYGENHGIIINSGTIETTNGDGIFVYDDNEGNITNSGIIKVEKGSGIGFYMGVNRGTILNSGTIEVTDGSGIDFYRGNFKSIINRGTIVASQNGITLEYNKGEVLNDTDGNITVSGNVINIGENEKTITNNGILESNGSMGIGIEIEKNNTISGVITNNGRIVSNFKGINIEKNNEGSVLNGENGEIDSVIAVGVFKTNAGNITNAGTINAGSTGIFVYENNGTIENDGVIKAKYYGVNSFMNRGSITINKDGNISSEFRGVYILNNTGTLTNEGVITSEKEALRIDGNNEGNITNKGVMKSSETNVLSISGNNYATIINGGSITSENGTAVQMLDNHSVIKNEKGASISAKNAAVEISNNYGKIINDGNVKSKYYEAFIINTNKGDFFNDIDGNISSSGDFAVTIKENDGNVTNSGIIENQGGFGIYILVNNYNVLNDTDGKMSSDVSNIFINENHGNITNRGSIASDMSIGMDCLNNYGNILNDATGKIESNLSSITVNLNEGNITNNGTLVSSASNGINVETNNTGNIINGETGKITAGYAGIFIKGEDAGNVINDGYIKGKYAFGAYSSKGVFINNGTAVGSIRAPGVDVTNNGKIEMGADEYVKVYTFTQNAEGVLSVGMEINSTTLQAKTSEIYTYKNIVFKDGATINVNVINTLSDTINRWYSSLSDANVSGYKEFNNSEGVIAESRDGNISADINKLKFTDNSALLAFSAENNGTVMRLIVKKSANLEQLATSAGDVYAAGAAKALDEIFSSSNINGDIDRFLTNLDSQATDAQKAQSIAEITPAGVLSASTAALQASGAVSGAIGARQRGANSGDSLFKDRNLWIKPYYTYTTQSDKDGYKGFSSHTRGFVIGADGEYGDSKRAGLAFAYGRSNVDTNGLPQSNDIDSYTLIAYGSNPVIDSDTMMSYQAGFGIQRVDSSRYISTTNQTATASYNAKLFYAQAVMNRNMELKNRLIFVPRLKMAYKYYHNPGYSESGAGGLDLNVRSYNTEEFIIGAGGALNYSMGMGITLRAYANVDYNTINDRQTVSASFQGANDVVFQTGGIKNSAATFNGGMSVDKKLQNNTSFSFGFNIDRKTSGFTSRNVFAKYNMKF